MAHLSMLSYHTSPLSQPGTGDGGGMNVYVREMASALGRLGHDVDVFTRREDPSQSRCVNVEPGVRVIRLDAGPPRLLERDELPLYVESFADAVASQWRRNGVPELIHANYWLSAVAGHRLKHEFEIPLAVTFHTLERVKAELVGLESENRSRREAEIVACADSLLASCEVEVDQFIRLYDADPARIRVVPLGVEHAFFAPGDRNQARRALGLRDSAELALFVGRLQLLKGVDLALETVIELRRRGRDIALAIVGGPSGRDGRTTVADLHARVDAVGMSKNVSFVAPQSHQLLSTWMRAADVTLVPSRSESFGLVALESGACGTPVVASAVGGLSTLVVPDVTGYLVDDRDQAIWANAVERVLDADRSVNLANASVLNARRFTWRRAAQSLAELATQLSGSRLVLC